MKNAVVTLNKTQIETIRLMRDGAYIWRASKNHSKFYIQEGDRHRPIKVTAESLLKLGIIGKTSEKERYYLTELGKTISL